MNSQRVYLSTTIPYVNARPHLGFALELVQADVLARHHRLAGDQVRFQTGTDDNSLKNVLAAEAEGIAVAALVDRNAAAFAALREPLSLSSDDFIRTGSDPRHLPGVERLWHACAARGDLYRKRYDGQYCVGCEQFYRPAELPGGLCPEHGTRPERVAEENWFFRLSRYAGRLHDLISSGRLRIEPAARRNEVLGFIAGGLEDFSASRSTARARGWGIPVPGDPDQVIYVWWDALDNYITALGYGTGGTDYRRWWTEADRRVHLVGKGVLRFQVPRGGDADFTAARLVARANDDLANDLGNLVSRVVTLVHRYRDGKVPRPGGGPPEEDGNHGPDPRTLAAACQQAWEGVAAGLAAFDFRAATAAIWEVVDRANRYVEQAGPWRLARAERDGDPGAGLLLDGSLALLVAACSELGRELAPFLPDLAARIHAACDDSAGQLPPVEPVFPRIALAG